MIRLRQLINNGLSLSLYAIAATFPLDYRLSNPWIILLVVFWLLSLLFGEEAWRLNSLNKWQRSSFYAFILFFAWHLISLLYSDDFTAGLKAIEGKLSLLVFPLVLYNMKLTKARIWTTLRVFYASIALAILYLLINSAYNFLTAGNWLTYHDFTAPFGAHAVFFSYFLFFSILLGVYEFNSNQLGRTHKVILGIIIGISFIGLLFCASKNVSIVTIFFSLVILVRRYFRKGFRLKEVLLLLLGFAIVIISALQMDAVKSRMAELSSGSGMENFDVIRSGGVIEEADNHKYNGTSLRVTLWYLGIDELIERERLLIGLSPADRKQIMNERYREVGMGPYRDYNLHNQFIQTLVELGLIGLLLYLLIYFTHFAGLIKMPNQLLLVFLLATIIFQLTESILERNKVIVFVMFFVCLLQALNFAPDDESRHTGN